MVIADRNTVRRYSGNRSPAIVSDADIDSAIAWADSFVQLKTKKFDWTITEPGYEVLKQASEYFAAADILGRFQDKEKESLSEWDRGKELIQAINDNFAAATDNEEDTSIVNIVSGTYKTSPLNPNAPYRRANGRLVSTSEAEMISPELRYAGYWW